MAPNFRNNDWVIVWRHSRLQRGDIVILRAPDKSLYIKRVIGESGDQIRFTADQLYVNRRRVSEPYLAAYKQQQAENNNGLFTVNFTLQQILQHKTVPRNQYFVMGDNRSISKDSRMIGFVPKSKIVGKVVWRYWPLNRWTVY